MKTLFSITVIAAFMWLLLECRYDKPYLWFTWMGKRKYIRLF